MTSEPCKIQPIMSNFPPEIVFDILVRLPPKDLIRCMCVSKAWEAFIRDQHFIKVHLERAIKTNNARTILFKECGDWYDEGTDFFASDFCDIDTIPSSKAMKLEQPLQRPGAPTNILGYSNGVVCLGNNFRQDEDGDGDGDGDLALWNPSIQKLKKIPFPTFEPPQPSSDSEMIRKLRYGFGYDSTNDDYKLVAIAEFENWDHVIVGSQVKVYSLKSNSWKRIPNMPYNSFRFYSDEGVLLNGALSWLIHNKLDKNLNMILTLDLSSEKYHEIPMPFDGDNTSFLSLEVFQGYLCLLANGPYTCDAWIMKEYGVTESWTLLYSTAEEFDDCKPLVLLKNGQLVILMQNYADYDRLCIFDLEKKSGKQVEICGLPRHFEATICVGSLCLLDGDPVIVGR